MGATEMRYFVDGTKIEEAYQELLNALDAEIEDETWHDPKGKPGFVKVWDAAVEPNDAVILAWHIMTGRVPDNQWSEAERGSNMPKFGPWYVIHCGPSAPGLPENSQRWLFFGWVNT